MDFLKQVSVGRTYRTRSGTRLKVIALARDGKESRRATVVFINKDTFRKRAPGGVWTSGMGYFQRLTNTQ